MGDYDNISPIDPATWDGLRRDLGESQWASLSLHDIATHVGMRWSYLRGNEPVRSFLRLSWDELIRVRGFGRKKLRHLLTVLTRARTAGPIQASQSEIPATGGDPVKTIRANLQKLSIPLWSSVDLLVLPARASAFLRRSGARDIGGVIDVLRSLFNGAPTANPGVGRGTIEHLCRLSAALLDGRPERVESFLPLGPAGYGLSIERAASHLCESFSQNEREMLDRHFGEQWTLRQAASYVNRTRGRASQIVSAFVRGLGRVMESFPEDRLRFWKAWEHCEPIMDLLEEEVGVLRAKTLAGAIERIFARSREGRAIISGRREQFEAWRRELSTMTDLHEGGVRVAEFLRAKGAPHLYVPFLEFLAHKHTYTVNLEAGTVVGKRQRRQLAAVEQEGTKDTGSPRCNLGRLQRGQRTPESQYYTPMLRVLERMGGGGKVGEVLKQVRELMTPILKDVDYDLLASNPGNPRWRNAAQWARNSLVRGGLLKANSPRGVWEITDKGRAALKEATRKP